MANKSGRIKVDDPWAEISAVYVSSEVILYSIEDLMKMSGWSHGTVEKLFNDPKFPAIDFGRKNLLRIML